MQYNNFEKKQLTDQIIYLEGEVRKAKNGGSGDLEPRVDELEREVSEINALIPESASAENPLATMSDIPQGGSADIDVEELDIGLSATMTGENGNYLKVSSGTEEIATDSLRFEFGGDDWTTRPFDVPRQEELTELKNKAIVSEEVVVDGNEILNLKLNEGDLGDDSTLRLYFNFYPADDNTFILKAEVPGESIESTAKLLTENWFIRNVHMPIHHEIKKEGNQVIPAFLSDAVPKNFDFTIPDALKNNYMIGGIVSYEAKMDTTRVPIVICTQFTMSNSSTLRIGFKAASSTDKTINSLSVKLLLIQRSTP